MRRYVLVTYDIADNKRLRKVFKLLRGNGDGFQDSVFICQLSEREEAIMREKLHNIINHDTDQVAIIRLGNVERENISTPCNWTVLGKKIILRDNQVMIY